MPRRTISITAALLGAAIACRSEPVDTQALLTAHSLGLNDLRRGQLTQAEEQFKKVVEFAPKDPTGFTNLGLTYLRGGRFKEAEAELRRAQRLNPASAEVGLIIAKLYSLTGRNAEARKTLEGLPRDARALYALAELERLDTSAAGADRHVQRLRDALATAPTNIAVRLELADALLRRTEADSVTRHLEELRRLRPEPPKEAKPLLDATIQQLRAGRGGEARVRFDRFLHLMQVTSPYQASLDAVKWVDGPLVGRPVLTFNPTTLIQTRGLIPVKRDAEVRFVDVTTDVGLPGGSAATAIALGDYDGDGADDILASPRLFHVQGGYVADVSTATGIDKLLPLGVTHAAFGDFDNDGSLDLFALGANPRLLRNLGSGKFEDVTAQIVTPSVARGLHFAGARKSLWADLDHDGDVDLLVAGDPTRLFRNNLDGTFTDVAASAGIQSASNDAAIGDFDGDGRIDLVVARPEGVALLQNAGFQQFRDVTAARGLADNQRTAGVVVGDYDNDGSLDLVTLGDAGAAALWRNNGDGTFAPDRASASAFQALTRSAARAAEFVDYDNDGWLDLVAAGPRGIALLGNTGSGRFEDRFRNLPRTPHSGASVIPSDIDGDGDQDLLIGDSSGVYFLRNEGGNARMALQVQLVGLRAGSGKNNTFGVGARVEVRAGEIYQARVVTSRITHFGLGPHLKADVVRVEWTNGVPETVYFPGTDQDILELETLKGSCAFLYTWDGKAFRFVTDVMWRSALGMPLGIMGGGGRAYAPAGASQEYLRIPGDALQPRNGRYVLQVTEELWETAFLDEVRLVAVDHPDSIDVFVDERFVPPGPVELRMLRAVNRRPPLTAVDERGNDVLPALRDKDDVYVSNLVPAQYQGVVEPHDLIMDLGAFAARSRTQLVLRGWIYPSDASINVALAQQRNLKVSMPSLEVLNARGQWETAVPSLGFPSGKDKTMFIDLAGKFPTSDHRVRIRTNMQIYWDQAFVATDAMAVPVRSTTLRRLSADLHFRGYSRMYRKGGRHGPHWFDYATVSKESPWRTITGAFTRFGDVSPLLDQPDDQYVVMAPGDEATIEFDATSATAVPTGWKRTFLLYTDGWIKDADLNTAFGNTVEPLPFHAIKEYPYATGEAYPGDSTRQRYQRSYNTRVMGRH